MKKPKANGKQSVVFEELDQYDYIIGDYLDEVIDDYSGAIGHYLLYFSALEHCINGAVNEIINNRTDETGFVITNYLKTSFKMDLFYKMYLRLEPFKKHSEKKKLEEILKKLKKANTFRNSIVHANWLSLTRNGYIRTKVMVDNQEGFIKFKMVKMNPEIIYRNTKMIRELSDQIEEYVESSFEELK